MDKKEKIINLIAKLKALATNNPNQEEAALAGARMQELIDRYKIAQAELMDLDSEEAESETDCHDFYSESGQRFSRWKMNLAFALARFNNCRGVSRQGGRYWDPKTASAKVKSASMVIVGTEENVAACRYVFSYLCGEIDRLAEKALVEYNRVMLRKGGKSFSNAFRAGAVDVVIRRLREQKKRIKQEAGTALVLFDREAKSAADWMRENMKTKPIDCSMTATDVDGYHAGKEAGKGLHLGGNESPKLGAGQKSLPR